MGSEERKGSAVRGDASRRGSSERAPERWISPREHTSPTRRKKSGCEQGERLSGWDQAAVASARGPSRVLRENARAERGRVTFFRSPGRRKALKGEAHERWELKEAPQGAKAFQAVERVAKPWGRYLKETRATVSGRPAERRGEKRGDRFRNMLKGTEVSARRFLKKGFSRGPLE